MKQKTFGTNQKTFGTNMPYSLRHASLEDAPRLCVLGTYVWLDTYANEGVSYAIADYLLQTFTPAIYRARIQNSDSAIVVAEIASQLVGFLVLRYNHHYADVKVEVETVYVQPSYTRIGIGTALLLTARTLTLERMGDPIFWLKVNTHNHRAIHFYRSLGLTEEGKTDFELDGTKHENLVMVSRKKAAILDA